MHVSLPILGGHKLMGTDAPESMGFKCKPGNNVYINLSPDTRAETDRLFQALSEGGKVGAPRRAVLGRLLREPGRPLRDPVDVQLRGQGLTARRKDRVKSAREKAALEKLA